MSTTVDIQVNTTVPGNQQRPTTLLQSDNTFWVIWESDAAGATGIYARHYSATCSPLGGEIQLVAGGAIWSWPYAERLPDDGWVLIWDGDDGDQSGVFGQRFDAGGNPVGSSFQANTTTADSQESSGRLTVLEGGGWVVMWHSVSEFPVYSSNGVWGRVYDPNGQPLTAEFRIDTVSGAYHYPCQVNSLAGGGWLATWIWTDDHTDWHAYGQRYDAQGAPVGAPFAFTPDSTSYVLFRPLPDGGWIAGWSASNAEDTDGGVFVQRYSSNGNPVGDAVKVNTTTDGNQFFPGDFALLSDGGWVVLYGTNTGPNINDFYGQRYDVNGTPVGDEFLITSTAQYSGWGTPLADGGWAPVWMNNDGDIGVAARVYDANGNPVGEEFQVNAYTAGHQFPLSYEAFPDGSWVVIWESYGQDGSDNGVYMRLFDAGSGSDGGTTITGTPGNDFFITTLADENFDGVAGIDTVVVSGIRSDYSLSKTTGGYRLQDTISSRDGTDTLINIERLQFSDKKIALDLAPTDNAGQAVLFIGVLAPSAVASPDIVGLILDFVDDGMSIQQLNQLAVDVGLVHDLAGGSSNADVAGMAFENVVGVQATPDMINLLVSYMDGRSASFTQSEFLTAVANLEVNQANVDLVGLAQTGIEYAFG